MSATRRCAWAFCSPMMLGPRLQRPSRSAASGCANHWGVSSSCGAGLSSTLASEKTGKGSAPEAGLVGRWIIAADHRPSGVHARIERIAVRIERTKLLVNPDSDSKKTLFFREAAGEPVAQIPVIDPFGADVHGETEDRLSKHALLADSSRHETPASHHHPVGLNDPIPSALQSVR